MKRISIWKFRINSHHTTDANSLNARVKLLVKAPTFRHVTGRFLFAIGGSLVVVTMTTTDHIKISSSPECGTTTIPTLAAQEINLADEPFRLWFQVEMTGSSIFDYCHAGDHAEIAEQLGLSLTSGSGQGGLASPSSAVGSDEGTGSQGKCPQQQQQRFKLCSWINLQISLGLNLSTVAATMTLNSTSAYKGYDRAFCIRMKSTLTKRGCHFKSSGYRVSFRALSLIFVFFPLNSHISFGFKFTF